MSTGAKPNPFLVLMTKHACQMKITKVIQMQLRNADIKIMIKMKLNNNIKITSNSKVSAPDLLTFYHIKYELSIAGLFLFQPQSYQPFIPKQTTKKTLISSFKDSNMVIQIFHPGLQAQVFTNIREVVTPHSNYDVGDGAPWQ